VTDLSPGLAAALGLDTDDDCVVTITDGSSPGGLGAGVAAGIEEDDDDGHGSNNSHTKPPIKQFIQSPNRSSRNGARIEMIVLHCTEGSWEGTKNTFLNAGGRQVSAHYVIDRNGDIYQMVADNERANHARGANSNSIGIEHVGSEIQSLADQQAESSAQLIRWLLAQYDIPRTNVYGHDFAPGYSSETSCPDKLFGSVHSQATIADWVARNV
jgi:N-acetyl-anhydromuramyl-L-alanine amidase AmpD